MLSEETEQQSPFAWLATDHRRLDALIDDLSAMVEDGELERAESCVGDLDAGLRRHIRLEEEIVFPIFEAAVRIVGPTIVMRAEHRDIEARLEELKAALAMPSRPRASTALAELLLVLESHNRKEERVIYPRVESSLSPAERRELVARLKH
jgi:iron-sulfur cluster repair protein YtfE (RIC family)